MPYPPQGRPPTGALPALEYTVTDDIMNTNDAEKNGYYLTPTKVKETQIGISRPPRTVRVSFEIRNGDGTTEVHGRVYKNGVAFGADQYTTSATYVLFSQSLQFTSGDLIQLYIWTLGPSNVYTRAFQVRGRVVNAIVWSDSAGLQPVIAVTSGTIYYFDLSFSFQNTQT